ncbi:MBL fold metallo-hydrolase [Chloroflexota bacterium]
MKEIEIYTITSTLRLLCLQPPIPGYKKFLGTYLFCGEKNAIIDVGPTVAIPDLLSALVKLKMNPEEIDYVVLTHIHQDHAGGVGTAIKELSKAKVLVHSRARYHLIDPTRLWEASLNTLGAVALEYGSIEPVPEGRIVVATDLMKLDLGRGLVLEIYLTPGHASHHLSLFDRTNSILIAGEAAGACIYGTIRLSTPPPFHLEEALSSIDRLITLEPQRLCYGHFGCYDNASERLRTIRKKLLEWYEIVNIAAEPGESPEDILVILRKKDRSLDYLCALSGDEYNREHEFLINSIKGLAGSGH